MSRYTLRIPCKIGYGFNDTLKYFYKFDDANPQNAMSTAFKQVVVNTVFDLSCTYLTRYQLGRLLEDQTLKAMDFHIVNDDTEYYQFGVIIYSKKETCSRCENLPENTEYYVKDVRYGTRLEIIVPKTDFPDTNEEMKKLLESGLDNVYKLTEVQKNVKCRVLINAVEEREMTLENVIRFNNECLEGQRPGHEIVVSAEIEKNKHTSFVVKNDANFREFLLYVYTAYRKIEMKMEKTGHPRIEPVPERAPTLGRISSNLQKSKEEYSKLDFVNGDILKIYAVLKTLFWNYRHYLEYVIEKRLSIDEGDDVPPGWEEGAYKTAVEGRFKTLLKKLNNWTPVKIGTQTYITEDKLLFVPDDFEGVETKIRQLISGIVVKRDNLLTEPRLFINKKINGFFGFVDMSRPSPNNADVEKMECLTLKCPETCSEKKLQWICLTCGDVARTSDFKIVCSCGCKSYNDQMFTCNDVRHKIKAMKTDKLRTIALQLRKHQDRNDTSTNGVIHNAIKSAVKSLVKIDQETDEINALMTEMKKLTVFDGDTSHLIDKYLTEHPC